MSKPMAKSAIKVMTMLNLNREQAEKVDATFASYAVDLAALRAENAKLREALAGMLEWFGKYPEFVPSNGALESGKIDSAIKQARAAFAEPVTGADPLAKGNKMKLSVQQQKALIPDEEIHQAFLERKDIAVLSPNEQERRWKLHLKKIGKFREFLSGLDSIVLPRD